MLLMPWLLASPVDQQWWWQCICRINVLLSSMRISSLLAPFEVWAYAFPCSDAIVSAMASQITSLTIVHSIDFSGADQRKHQRSALPAFVRGILRWPLHSPNRGPVTRKFFSFDDVIMFSNAITTTRVEYTKFLHTLFYFRHTPVYHVIQIIEQIIFHMWTGIEVISLHWRHYDHDGV